MTLFSRLGVSSDMAAPSCWPGCVWPPPVQPDSGPPALPNCAKDSVRHQRILVLFVFVLVIIVIVRILRWCRVACDSENLVDASSPLLLQMSMKLYGIDGHVVLLLTFVFERWTRSDSSPSASAQYISASFRYWRLCRRDFATAARRANFFAFAR